ncbi:variable surface protein [Plasmodium gonderi]|uniref:Variable surface protein n=1 Tax=Plasmodium gonderi TaxID=77519 RepID=A0A1Y1JUV4_PLAGO|nr:variable surface protein [Plasmodium gonderi]GAW84193.1 variable surface protein [Plasmodium gonderi]
MYTMSIDISIEMYILYASIMINNNIFSCMDYFRNISIILIKTEIEEDNKNEAERIFNYLKKYVNTLTSDQHVKKCTFEFERENDINYENIKNLYNIYNVYCYINHIMPYNLLDVNFCYNIESLIEKYNAVLKNLNVFEDIALRNKLYHIRCLHEEAMDLEIQHDQGPNLEKDSEDMINLKKEHERTMHLEKDFVKIFARRNINKNIIITTVLVTIVIGTIFLYFYRVINNLCLI